MEWWKRSASNETAEDGVVDARELPSEVGPSSFKVGAIGSYLPGTRFGFTLERRERMLL